MPKQNFDFKKHTAKWKLLLASDIVVFSYINKKLNILLVKRKYEPGTDKWAIPGGFVREHESLEESALRELKEETGLKNEGYLEQLYTFGEVNRDPRARVISVAYMVLIKEPEKVKLKASDDAIEAKWFAVDDLPELAFGVSHKEIILYAWQRLRWKLEYTNVAFSLLKNEFTLSEMQGLYETVYNKKIDKRNFRKKIMALNLVKSIDKFSSDAGRPAQLYKTTTKGLKIYTRII